MKQFTAVVFLFFCSQTLAQNKANIKFTNSGLIEANSTSTVTCEIKSSQLVPKDTPNVKVVVSASFGNEPATNFGEWFLTANNDLKTNWNVTFKNDKNASESKGVTVIKSSCNLTLNKFELDLKLNKDSPSGNYSCKLEDTTPNKTKVLQVSNEIPTSIPIYYTELTVDTTKFTINKQFNVDCKVVATGNLSELEIYQVDYYKENEILATYKQNDTDLSFFPSNIKTLTNIVSVSNGTNKLQSDYQIIVKPLTKDAAGKYSCVASSWTKKDKLAKQSIESNVLQVSNNSARWAFPSIILLLVNLSIFLHF